MGFDRILSRVFLFIALLVMFPHSSHAQTNIRIGTTELPGSPIVTSLEGFSSIINRNSAGKIRIEILKGQLGDPQRLVDQVSLGEIEMAIVPTATLSNRFARLQILELPFLFASSSLSASYAKVDELLYQPESKGKNLFRLPDDPDIIGLTFFEYGLAGIVTKKQPITMVSDYKGIKIRTPASRIISDSLKALGASPVGMPFAESYSAIQTGAIDSTLVIPSEMYFFKFYETAKHYSLTSQAYNAAILIISKKIFQSLPNEYKEIIMGAAMEISAFQRALSRNLEESSLKNLTSLGVQVSEDINFVGMREAVSNIYNILKEKLGCNDCKNFPWCCIW